MLGGFNSVVASEELSGILIDHKLLFENYLLNSVKILKLHERIVCKGHFSSFEELLSKEKSVTVYQKSLQTLATEMYEILNGFSSDIMQTFLKLKVTTIILLMHQHFPQEILKQLDMDYRPTLLGTLYQRDEASYYSE